MANNNTNKDPDVLVAIFGGKTFVKVYQALDIGKIKFSFANKSNPKDGIDCYMDCNIFNCDLIDKITSKDYNNITTLEKLALAEKKAYAERKASANGQTIYHKPIWESPAGVNDGNVVRKFEIQPADNTDYMFRATEGKKCITVGCEARYLSLLAENWSFLKPDYDEYMRAKYNKKAMANTYHNHKIDDAPTQYVVDDTDNKGEIETPAMTESAPTPTKTESAKTETVKEQDSTKKVETCEVEVRVVNEDFLTPYPKDNKKFAIKTKRKDTNEKLNVIFMEQFYTKCEQWERLKEALLSKTGVSFSANVEIDAKTGYAYFKSLPT